MGDDGSGLAICLFLYNRGRTNALRAANRRGGCGMNGGMRMADSLVISPWYSVTQSTPSVLFRWQKYPILLRAQEYKTHQDYVLVTFFAYYFRGNTPFGRGVFVRVPLKKAARMPSFDEMARDPRKIESLYRLAHWYMIAFVALNGGITATKPA